MAIGLISHRMSVDTIPNFVSAKSKQGLRRAMLRNNTRHKGVIIYQDIQFDPINKEWVAWYYVRAEQELMDGGNS